MPTNTATQDKHCLTIQQMARQSGLSEHPLRYYERIGLLMPVPRDLSSRHQRYSPDTADIVETLACLRAGGTIQLGHARQALGDKRGHLCRSECSQPAAPAAAGPVRHQVCAVFLCRAPASKGRMGRCVPRRRRRLKRSLPGHDIKQNGYENAFHLCLTEDTRRTQ